MATANFFCMKCKTLREAEAEETTMKNGRPALKGNCPICSTGLFKIKPKGT